MANEPAFVTENAKSQQELRDLLSRLRDNDLARDMGGDWTVAVMLSHMAFYDFRAAAVVDRWRRESTIDPFPIDAQLTNNAIEQLLLAIPPRSAAQLALKAAVAADEAMAGLPAELAVRIEGATRSVSLFRSEHRREHIKQIEQVLASSPRTESGAR